MNYNVGLHDDDDDDDIKGWGYKIPQHDLRLRVRLVVAVTLPPCQKNGLYRHVASHTVALQDTVEYPLL